TTPTRTSSLALASCAQERAGKLKAAVARVVLFKKVRRGIVFIDLETEASLCSYKIAELHEGSYACRGYFMQPGGPVTHAACRLRNSDFRRGNIIRCHLHIFCSAPPPWPAFRRPHAGRSDNETLRSGQVR